MTKEQLFLQRWEAEKVFHLAWGKSISAEVEGALAHLITAGPPSEFLRAAARPRLKDDLKLVEKAFYRGKNYTDPYVDITDKVGTRFVVLLGRDIRTVENALLAISGWTASRDRDYEEEQKANPIAFDYAAVHFVVRPEHDTVHDGVSIPAGTPCEVQIKTLLQHAYSELTHDTIYKPQIEATTNMRRNAAKSMALLEATNDYFERVQDEVEDALSSVRNMTATLSEMYHAAVGFAPRPSALEGLLLAAYEKDAGSFNADVETLLAEKPFVVEAIRRRVAEKNPLFAQPSILLAYLEISRSLRAAKERWPLTEAEHMPLLNDLGEG